MCYRNNIEFIKEWSRLIYCVSERSIHLANPFNDDHSSRAIAMFNRKWQDYVYIQCEYKSTKQKVKHLLRDENKVKENKIS